MGCECGNSNGEQFFVGTDLKYMLKIEAPGFDMDDDYYDLTVRCGGVTVAMSKADVTLEDGEHYLTIDTSPFPNGVLQLEVCAHVNDSTFPDSERTEIKVLNLCKLRRR